MNAVLFGERYLFWVKQMIEFWKTFLEKENIQQMFPVKMSASTNHKIVSRSITKCPVTTCFVQRFVGDYCTYNDFYPAILTFLFFLYISYRVQGNTYFPISDLIQGGSNMTGTDLYVNKPHYAAAMRPWESEATTSTLPPARVRTCSVLSRSC